jgi:membrane fusion protein (multidrug efflux system)
LLLSLLTLLLLVFAVLWLYRWWTEGRYFQTTNNAYLQADAVAVAPRVSGHVTELLVQDNQLVQAGQPLLRIDSRSADAVLAQAQAVEALRQADIEAARARIDSVTAQRVQAQAELQARQVTLAYAESELARFAPLVETGADTQEHLQSLQHQRDQAHAQTEAAQAQLRSSASQIKAAQAQLAQSHAGLRQAQADTQRAQIPVDDAGLSAPTAGRIGDRTVRVGQVVAAGTRLMSIVPLDSLYLNANFKETQLQLMRAGQAVEVQVDALGGQSIKGEVESMAPGTGTQFALLPPENATGNFTKIVQRVTVRIKLYPSEAQKQVLLPGMSAEVTVDTRSAREADVQASGAS